MLREFLSINRVMVLRHFSLDEYNYSVKRCALTGRSYTTTTTTTNGGTYSAKDEVGNNKL